MSIFGNNTNGVNWNVLGTVPSSGGGLDTLAELDEVITQLNIESHTVNTNGNIATVDYVNSLVISSGSFVGSDPVLISSGNVSLKYDNNSLILNTSGQLVQNVNYVTPSISTSGDINLFGGGGANINFRNSSGTILSSVNNNGSLLNISAANTVLSGVVSITNLLGVNISSSSVATTTISGSNLRVTQGTIGNFHSNNLHAVVNATVGNLICGDSSITNIASSNSTISNLNSSNSTISNLVSGFASITNIATSNSSISNLISSNSSIGTLVNTNGVITNASITNLALSGTLTQTNLSANNSTINNLVSGSASITNIATSNSSISNLVNTNSTITNLINTNGVITNASITNLSLSGTLTQTNISATNSTISNLVSGFASITNIANSNLTASNLVNTNSSITNLVNTNSNITNLSVSNLSLSGALNQTNINSTNATISNLVSTNISSSAVNVGGRVFSRVDAAGFNSNFAAFPIANEAESSIAFYNNTAGSTTSEGNVYVVGHNVFGSGNRTFGIGTPWNGSILTINTSGTTRFNNNLEVVRSGTVPSLLISGGVTGGNGASVRLVGGGEPGSSVQIDMSTYDPLTNDPTSRIRVVDENFSSNMLFQTKTPGAVTNSLTTRMYINNDGKVGINTTSPSAQLTVVGDLSVLGNSAGGTITHIVGNNAPETSFTEARLISVVSNTNKFSNLSTYLGTSGSVYFNIELSRTAGSNIVFSIDPDRQETSFRYGLYGPLDVQQDLWDLNISTGSLGGRFTPWNRLYLKGNAYVRNIYARTTGQLIGTDDTDQGYRFNILADNITSNNLLVSNISGATNLSSTNITSTNILTSNISSNSLVIRRNTSNWNPSIYLNSPTSGNENYMMFNNISGGPISVGSWLVGTPSGVTGGTFQIGFANTSPYAFNIMTSGNIGIGTTSPNYRLHVDGTAYVRTTTGILLHGSDSPMITRSFDPFLTGNYTGAGRWGLFMEGGATTLGIPAGGSGRRHQFVSYNDDSTINTTMMTILTSGNVGLTITNPSYQLHLSQDSAGKPSSTLWTVTSDERLKTNITQANLDICYDNVKNLPLKRYTWRDEIYTEEEVPDRSKLGWIAQDVEQVIPKAVEQKDMHGYSDCRSLNADQIIASLYGAVQKLIEKVDKHEEILDIITNKSPSIRKLFNN